MNRRSVYITIPTPCHESWDSMDATARGAFCHSCQKEVVDFTTMTDREVVEFLSKTSVGCGKLRSDQLNTKLTIPQLENGAFKWRALLLGVLSFINVKNSFAQTDNKQQTRPITAAKNVTRQNTAAQKEVHPIILNDVVVTGNRFKHGQNELLGIVIAITDTPTLLPSGDVVLKPVLLYQDSSNHANKDPELRLNHNEAVNPNINRPDEAKYILSSDHITHSPKIKYWFRRAFSKKYR